MTPKFQNKYRIGSNRLSGWDYSGNGYYFITLVVQNRHCIFGNVDKGNMVLNNWGQIAYTEWLISFEIRNELFCHAFVIMPNHLHAIVEIDKKNCTDMVDNHSKNNECINVGRMNGDDCAACRTARPCGSTSKWPCGSTSKWPCGSTSKWPCGSTCNPTNQNRSFIRKPKSISSFVAGYKSAVTTGINNLIDQNPNEQIFPNLGKFNRNNKLWQPNYYDHIIRNEKSFDNIQTYINENPLKWDNDKFCNENN